MKQTIFMFPFVNGSVKFAGKGSEVRPSNRIRQDKREKNTAVIFKENPVNQLLQSNSENETNWKGRVISGACLEAAFIVFICKKDKKSSLPQEKIALKPTQVILMSSGGQTQRWMYCRKVR